MDCAAMRLKNKRNFCQEFISDDVMVDALEFLQKNNTIRSPVCM